VTSFLPPDRESLESDGNISLRPSQSYPLLAAGESTRTKDTGVAIIRREFVELTGDHFSAVILNQLLYWTQRVKDFDLLLEEERSFHPECNVSPRHGWIYKTANDLNEETLLGISHPTMRKYLRLLIDQGWIDERAHPIDKWNKTTQYRVNLRKLQEDLIAIGYNLPDPYLRSFSASLSKGAYPNEFQKALLLGEETSNVKNLHSNENPNESSLSSDHLSEEIPNVRNLHSNAENLHSNVENFHSDVKNLHSYTYTETTSEIKSKEHTKDARARDLQWDSKEVFVDEAIGLWKTHIGQEVHLTEGREHQLQSILTHHFQNDLSQWEQFCIRIKASPFLMGEGSRRWRVSFDWILETGNILKVFEGNFDDPKVIDQKREEKSQTSLEKEISDVLASIEDPLWREWCSELNFSLQSKDSITLWELKEIANARFVEVEDGRLVWIGSSDSKVLNRIETLRLKIFPIIEKTFPNTRTLRTLLDESIPSTPQETADLTHIGENHE